MVYLAPTYLGFYAGPIFDVLASDCSFGLRLPYLAHEIGGHCHDADTYDQRRPRRATKQQAGPARMIAVLARAFLGTEIKLTWISLTGTQWR